MATEGEPELRSEAVAVLGSVPDAVEELPHGRRMGVTRRVTRVRAGDRRAVVKVVNRPTAGGGPEDPLDPGGLFYWAREPDLYRSGPPDPYTEAGIRSPRLLARVDRRGSTALWLEDVAGPGVGGADWSAAQYATCARRLGRAQGALAGRPTTGITAFPYTTGAVRAFLGMWERDLDWSILHDEAAWAVPLVRAHVPGELRRDLVALCADRHLLLDWMDRVPQTICHQDVWPLNVFDRGEETVLIDWALVGWGALGLDPGNLVTDSCGDLLVPAARLPELDAATTEGYRQGLAESGWTGSFDPVRLGMCAMAAKWCFLTVLLLTEARADRHRVYGRVEVDPDLKYAERAAMLAYHAGMAAEARTLAARLF